MSLTLSQHPELNLFAAACHPQPPFPSSDTGGHQQGPEPPALQQLLWGRQLSGLWYLQRVRSARRLGASEGCGTPTKDHHLHRCKSARLPLRHTHTQGPAIQLGPALATRQCHPAPLGPVNQDTQVPVNQDTQVPVAPHHLATTHQATTRRATTHQATTTMGIPPQGCRGAHQSTLAAIRNTIRSTRRSTPSPTSTTVASTQAARAARAVLILTEDNMFHLHGGEALEETAYEDKCPTGTTCLLFCPFLPSLQSAFCLSSDFFAFSL
ncbi:uncharacterized protein [Anser cygnoides]|uniref:uncharacterized protein n=1 Tax=Anser cygnoides TaxID=8845 RepID=UPI0034D228EB